MSCTTCDLGGHVSTDTTACEGCGRPFCDDCLVRDDSGAWCLDCNSANLRESLDAVGGKSLWWAERRYDREADAQREGML